MSNIKKTKTLDMTEGNIAKLLITFAIPLLLGNIFQYLYNTVDSLVVRSEEHTSELQSR